MGGPWKVDGWHLEDGRNDRARGVDGHVEPVGLGRVGGAVGRREKPLVEQHLEHVALVDAVSVLRAVRLEVRAVRAEEFVVPERGCVPVCDDVFRAVRTEDLACRAGRRVMCM